MKDVSLIKLMIFDFKKYQQYLINISLNNKNFLIFIEISYPQLLKKSKIGILSKDNRNDINAKVFISILIKYIKSILEKIPEKELKHCWRSLIKAAVVTYLSEFHKTKNS